MSKIFLTKVEVADKIDLLNVLTRELKMVMINMGDLLIWFHTRDL